MILWAVWVPAIAAAQITGVVMLLYGLEKVNGWFTRTTTQRKRTLTGSAGACSAATSKQHCSAKHVVQNGLQVVKPASEPSTPGMSGATSSMVAQRTSCPPDAFVASNAGNVDCELGQLQASLGTQHCTSAWTIGSSTVHLETRAHIPAPGATAADHFAALAATCSPAAAQSFSAVEAIGLKWTNMTCKVLDKKSMTKLSLLHGCTGDVRPGELCAIVGPSGAGKSTLLDILAMRKGSGELTGQVLVNDVPQSKQFKRMSAYVAQEEAFIPTYSALETLQFHAALRLPSSVSTTERLRRIETVLRVMGLWNCRHTQAGGVLAGGIYVRGLSGGERKRLNIACALIASPAVLFLDEPTTGLDSCAALSVMTHMCQLAAAGHTILASIHQPRAAIWHMFHKVAVLSQGHSLYFGPSDLAVAWFTESLGYQYQPDMHGSSSDWLMDLVSVSFSPPDSNLASTMSSLEDVRLAAELFAHQHQSPDKGHTQPRIIPSTLKDSLAPIPFIKAGLLPNPLELHVVTSLPIQPRVGGAEASCTRDAGRAADASLVTCAGVETAAQRRYPVGWGTQFQVLLRREFGAQLRNPTDAAARLLMCSWLGLLTGLTFLNLQDEPSSSFDRSAVLFWFTVSQCLLPFAYISSYVNSRKFYALDRAADMYTSSSYYAATVLANIPLPILNAVVFSFVAYGLAGLRDSTYAILMNSVIAALHALVAIQFLVMCVWLTPNQDMAYVIGCGFIAVCLLLGGFYRRIAAMRVYVLRIVSYATFIRYPFNALLDLEFQDLTWDQPCAASYDASTPGDAAVAGTPCLATGDQVLAYFDLGMSVGQAAAVMLGFLVIFHIVSFQAMSRLYKRAD